MSQLTESATWHRLQSLATSMADWNLRDAFAAEPNRVATWERSACGISFDFSKHLMNSEVFAELLKLADERKVQATVEAMFSGERINITENRAVLHTALRAPRNAGIFVDGVDVSNDVNDVLDSMEIFATKVRSGDFVGSTGKRIETVINIGIGGSDLGPVMAYEALKAWATDDIKFKFVSNVDGTDLAEALRDSDAASTLFIVASKTFTTSETMTNAASAKAWLAQELGTAFNPAQHFVALSTNARLVADFGIDAENVFGFWDWVGGRFSMDSAIGLSTMIAVGPQAFRDMLSGFRAMDEHVRNTPAENNVAYIMALLSLWYRNFFGAQSHAVLPYENYLKRFPAYLQQLLMESNGKSVLLNGEAVDFDTSPIYWGEPGTNGQHSFHQLLHQGTSMVPVDFLVGANSVKEVGNHHTLLLSNVLAQGSVLAFGKTAEEVAADGTVPELVQHKVMPGNRPSTFILYPVLSPAVLGSLIALYEHVTLVQGALWGVGSFDQWGVELGKKVASSITPALEGGDTAHLDASTAAAVRKIVALRQ